MDKSLLAALEVISQHGLEKEFVTTLMNKVKTEIVDTRSFSPSQDEIYIFTDGSVKTNKGGCGCVIYFNDKVVKTNRSLSGSMPSNHVEYEAIWFAVTKLKELNITGKKAIFFIDNKPIAEQLSGRAKCKGSKVGVYIINILCTLNSLNIEAFFSYTPRGHNTEAHSLASKARGNQIVEEILGDPGVSAQAVTN